jgi:predicted Zn-dependent protease
LLVTRRDTKEEKDGMLTTRSRRFVTILLFAAIAATAGSAFPRAAPDKSLGDEQEIGKQVFNELKAKTEIVKSSPLYDQLMPIVTAVTRTAQPHYGLPFKFYLVHEPGPNAFATPGGNVYVTDSLMYFVKNTEQLAGTICHEVSHTIHHDSMALIEKERRIQRRELGAAVLLGPSAAHVLAIALIGKLKSLGYSREAESAADLTGADICAASGYNPWGLVWLFQDFDNADLEQIPQLLSDHPDNPHRVQALKQHFRENPKVFGGFSADIKSAKPFTAAKDASEVFLR